jgi:hypothetical protein
MPKAQEEALKRIARRKGYTGERADAFVYGSMRRQGWKPSSEQSPFKSKRKR